MIQSDKMVFRQLLRLLGSTDIISGTLDRTEILGKQSMQARHL